MNTRENENFWRPLFGALSSIVPAIGAFLATPFIYRAVGPVEYGIYAVMAAVISYSVGFNVSRAVTVKVSQVEDSGSGVLDDLLSTAFWVTVGICVLSSLALYTALPYFLDVISPTLEDSLKGGRLIALAATALALQGLGNLFLGILQGFQRQFTYLVAVTLISISGIISSIGFSLNGYGATGLVAGVAISFIPPIVLGLVVALKRGSRLFQLRVNPGFARGILKHSVLVFAYLLPGNLVILVERFALGGSNLGTLSEYVLPLMLGIQFHALLNGLSLHVFPSMAKTGHDSPETAATYYKSARLIVILAIPAIVSAWTIGGPSIAFWLGVDPNSISSTIFPILITGFVFLGLSIPAFHLSEALGRTRINLFWTLGVVAINLLIIYYLGGKSPVEFAYGRLVSFSLWLFAIPFVELRLLGKFNWRFWVGTLLTTSLACLPLFVIQAVAVAYGGAVSRINIAILGLVSIASYLGTLRVAKFPKLVTGKNHG